MTMQISALVEERNNLSIKLHDSARTSKDLHKQLRLSEAEYSALAQQLQEKTFVSQTMVRQPTFCELFHLYRSQVVIYTPG